MMCDSLRLSADYKLYYRYSCMFEQFDGMLSLIHWTNPDMRWKRW